MARRRVAAGLAAALALGAVALLLAGALTRTTQVQTLGVLPVLPVAPLAPGQQACERNVALAEPFEAVRFIANTFDHPGPALQVSVRAQSGRLLGSGRVARGWSEVDEIRTVPVGRVDDLSLPLTICVRNRGPDKTWIWGDSQSASRRDDRLGVRATIEPGYATVAGRRAGDADLSFAFTVREPRSLLTRLPGMFRHAALFRPSFVGAWLYWALLAALALGAPLLLLAAATRAAREDDEEGEQPAQERPLADAPEPARERVPASSPR